MYVVIAGGGKVGANLARTLIERGLQIVSPTKTAIADLTGVVYSYEQAREGAPA